MRVNIRKGSTLVGFSLPYKYKARVKEIDSDKHSSLEINLMMTIK